MNGAPATNGRRITILIVDDDRLFVMRLRKLLLGAGYEVLHAYNGKDALERFQRHEIAVVIIDLVMPGQGGYETIRQLKQGAPGVKVIAASEASKDLYFEIARNLGADLTIRKRPLENFSGDEWLEAVTTLAHR